MIPGIAAAYIVKPLSVPLITRRGAVTLAPSLTVNDAVLAPPLLCRGTPKKL
jgi:hypothetical protein